MTTAKIINDFLKVDLVNAGFLDFRKCEISKFKINLILLVCVHSNVPLKYTVEFEINLIYFCLLELIIVFVYALDLTYSEQCKINKSK